MVRKLKHHEQKLLRKVDFATWKSDNNHRVAAVCRRYMIQKPEDYHSYNATCGVRVSYLDANFLSLTNSNSAQLAYRLSLLPPDSPTRHRVEKEMLDKLFDMGILSTTIKLSDVENKVTVSAFARRRLPVVMERLKMAPNLRQATMWIEQGQVRIGPDTVTDPALLVTRQMEDQLTWSLGSKVKRNMLMARDEYDDYDQL